MGLARSVRLAANSPTCTIGWMRATRSPSSSPRKDSSMTEPKT